MIIVKTPMRVSLLGGGSDDPAHFQEHGGAVLGMAINKYCWVTVRKLPPFFEHKHRLVYSKVETVSSHLLFSHPMVRMCLNKMAVSHGLEIHHDADLPARSGMGSSSTFAVGLIQAMAALRGEMMTKEQLAEAAIHVERVMIPEAGGWQDQVFAAHGGLNLVNFAATGYSVSPIVLPIARRNELAASIVLYFTGFSRNAHEVEASKRAAMEANADSLRALAGMANEAREILASNDSLSALGALISESWERKKRLSPWVSTPEIDAIYDAGLSAGAWGGKLLGAGGGGFMLFLCPYGAREALRRAMGRRIEINVEPDYEGSKIVLYQPNGL